MNREQMENWLTLEGWSVYNHEKDQSWDNWAFSRDGKNCWFMYHEDEGTCMSHAVLDKDEVPFPMERAPSEDLGAMYAWATTGEPE